MPYNWEKIIAPEEKIQKDFSISARYKKAILIATVVVSVILCIVVIYVGIAIFLLGLLYWYYLTKAKHYAFTSKRIILVDSFLGTNITSIDYMQISNIEIDQSALDMLGNWGTIFIDTAGTNSPKYSLMFIDNPTDIKQQLDTIRDSFNTTSATTQTLVTQ